MTPTSAHSTPPPHKSPSNQAKYHVYHSSNTGAREERGERLVPGPDSQSWFKRDTHQLPDSSSPPPIIAHSVTDNPPHAMVQLQLPHALLER